MTCCDASAGHTTTKGLASPGRINTVVLSAAVRADARVGTVARRDGGQRVVVTMISDSLAHWVRC